VFLKIFPIEKGKGVKEFGTQYPTERNGGENNTKHNNFSNTYPF